ncbi:MAG: homoserine dehydrogenase [Nitrospirae bacterium]|nr:homoserine dehydrogenase [Nitrospirota bacterium]
MVRTAKRTLGMLGCGTVGAEVIHSLLHRSSAPVSIKRVAVRDISKRRPIGPVAKRLTTDWREVVDDPEIEVVLELMGGETPALAAIKRALENGKSVITANKLVLSRHGHDLHEIAAGRGAFLGFRATLAGIHPIIFYLHSSIPSGKTIRSVHAVLNGTCNFVLDTMESRGVTFDEAVRRAQNAGFAEADPSLDVDGIDTMNKITIINRLIYGAFRGDAATIERNGLREGIREITPQDLAFASELGYCVKLLGIIENVNGFRSVRAHPALVRKDHPLAVLRGAENGIVIVDEYAEESCWTGLGAGAKPTRIAVLQDLYEWGQGRRSISPLPSKTFKFLPSDQLVCKYFLRFTVIDRPGVLAQISRVLWKNHISISAVVQKERREGDRVPLIITTHDARERNVRRAFGTILKLAVVKSPSTFIRIVV